jgi:hypothetical protein
MEIEFGKGESGKSKLCPDPRPRGDGTGVDIKWTLILAALPFAQTARRGPRVRMSKLCPNPKLSP